MKDYDPNKPSKFIQYLDANNLYVWAMIQRLPTNRIEWLPENKLTVNNVKKYFKRKYYKSWLCI